MGIMVLLVILGSLTKGSNKHGPLTPMHVLILLGIPGGFPQVPPAGKTNCVTSEGPQEVRLANEHDHGTRLPWLH